MRLVCPNCDAEYEVDDAAIPPTGRDVQCSNCGHAWFQAHPDMAEDEAEYLPPPAAQDSAAEDEVESGSDLAEDVAAKSAAESGAEDDAAIAAGAAANPSTPTDSTVPPKDAVAWAPQDMAVALAVEQAVAADAMTPTGARAAADDPLAQAAAQPVAEPSAATRNIDESVLAVLREEAAREVAARRAETSAPALETQTEMRLAPASASAAGANTVVARLKGEPEPKVETPAQATRPRRDLLPAIEEINSTLRASSGRSGEEEASLVAAEAAQASRNRFGGGFLTLVLLAVILLAIYILAPVIAEKVPALAGAVSAYVAAVDAARIWLDSQIRTLIGMLRGLEGSSKG
jgi:predicted Zn finger-like uncharacterized protein